MRHVDALFHGIAQDYRAGADDVLPGDGHFVAHDCTCPEETIRFHCHVPGYPNTGGKVAVVFDHSMVPDDAAGSDGDVITDVGKRSDRAKLGDVAVFTYCDPSGNTCSRADIADQAVSHLLGLVNEMDSTVTEVIRLQALGPGEADRHVPALVEKLCQQAAELEVFEREAVEI